MTTETPIPGTICGYGCKQEAKFVLKTKGGVKKPCCARRYQRCPAQKLKRGAISRLAHARRRLDGTVARRGVLRRCRREAEHRGVPWTISDNLFYTLMRGACYYCGKLPSSESGQPHHHNVDRFSQDEGWTPHNCVPCCLSCRGLKRDLSANAFWQDIRGVLTRHPNGILHPSQAVITKSA